MWYIVGAAPSPPSRGARRACRRPQQNEESCRTNMRGSIMCACSLLRDLLGFLILVLHLLAVPVLLLAQPVQSPPHGALLLYIYIYIYIHMYIYIYMH